MRGAWRTLGGLLPPLVAAALLAADARAEGWEVGHQIWFRSACHEKVHMTAVAKAAETSLDTANRRFTSLVRQGECVYTRKQVAAFLVERVSGPYASPEGPKAYVWRILDSAGIEMYVLLRSDTGPRHGLQPSR